MSALGQVMLFAHAVIMGRKPARCHSHIESHSLDRTACHLADEEGLMIRLLKCLIVLAAAMLCIFYAANNVANINNMYGVLSYVLGNQEHVVYPSSFGPSITMPALIWAAMIAVLIGEFGAGALALKGSWDLFRARRKSADDFQKAKTTALIACLVGVITWYGLFMAIGGAYFQMWQTEIGMASQADAFRFAAMLGILFLVVQSRDE